MAKTTDWEAIEREYRAGQLSVVEIARQHLISHTAINKRAKKEGWVRDLSAKVREAVAAKLVSSEVSGFNVRETVAFHADRGARIVLCHRKDVGQLRALSVRLADRLAQVMDGVQPEGPCLGERESVSDVLEKLTRVSAKLIPLERQAFGLDDDARRGETPETALQAMLDHFNARIENAVSKRLGERAKVIEGTVVR
jgi:hypothetical protein